MSVEEIIAKSSNIGVAKIALKLGKERLFQYIKDFGFGEQTFIPLPGEVTGTVRRLSNWEEISITRVPMGQEICTTAIQSAMSMCAIANGGRLMRPMLIDRIEDEKGGVVVKYQPQYVRQVCRPEIAKAMVTALKSVATTNGTAIKSSMENYTVAGKTGTAQKANGKFGYVPGKYYTSFIGFFPAEAPELCIYIGLDEPKNGHMGGLAAGPYFKNVADKTAKYLGIKPEFMKDESVTASGRSSNSIVTMGKGSNGVPVKHN
jgi:cell division protein FtsI/penicillin-binding protein 2